MASRLVYTSDPEEAKRLRESLKMPEVRDTAASSQTIRIELDRKSRGGKSVTLLSGFELTPATLQSLAKQLKSRCGSGGTVKDRTIEIQGDHRDTVASELTKLGYRVRRIG
ncbi:MAG TPA: translation initiation factor [Thermoanaerobaculia bacterium]